MSEAKGRNTGQGKLITTGVVVFLLLLVVLTFSNATFLTIDAGERGVLFRRFSGGLDKENIYTVQDFM